MDGRNLKKKPGGVRGRRCVSQKHQTSLFFAIYNYYWRSQAATESLSRESFHIQPEQLEEWCITLPAQEGKTSRYITTSSGINKRQKGSQGSHRGNVSRVTQFRIPHLTFQLYLGFFCFLLSEPGVVLLVFIFQQHTQPVSDSSCHTGFTFWFAQTTPTEMTVGRRNSREKNQKNFFFF